MFGFVSGARIEAVLALEIFVPQATIVRFNLPFLDVFTETSQEDFPAQ